MSKGNDIVVFISTRNSTCGECKQELGRRAWITLDRKRNALCLRGSRSPGVSSLRRCRTHPPFPKVLRAIGSGREKVYPKVSRILDLWQYGGSPD
jgi:hypothetical protein